jgi:quercetin dioxygenase-like cupin family protein
MTGDGRQRRIRVMNSTDSTSIWFLDSLVRVHVDATQTGGSYCVLEVLVPAGHMPPPHVHDQDAESFLVIEGEITLFTEAGPTVLRPGQSAHSPAGEAHTFRVTSAGRRGSSSSRPRPASWATSAPSGPPPSTRGSRRWTARPTSSA